MPETQSYPNVYAQMKTEIQRPGQPLVEGMMTIWLKGSRFRAREEAGGAVTEYLGDVASDMGLLIAPGEPARSIPARTIAKTAEQILSDSEYAQLSEVGKLERLGRACTEYKGTIAGQNEGGAFRSDIHAIVSPPYELLLAGRATDGSGHYLREVVELSEGRVTDDDFIPPGEDAPIGPACRTIVRVVVAEGDSSWQWIELEGEIEATLLVPDASLELLEVTLGEVDVDGPSATYLSNTHHLHLQIPSASEEVDEVVREVGLALVAIEKHVLAEQHGLRSFVNQDWANDNADSPAEVTMEARAADIGDELGVAVIHPGARDLMTDDWFWDQDDLAPFGSDDAALVVAELAEHHRRGHLGDAAAQLDALLQDALDEGLPEHDDTSPLPLCQPGTDDWDQAICIDEMTIAAAFAELALRGAIQPALSRRARLSLERQRQLDVPEEWTERVGRMLEILDQLDARQVPRE